MSDDGLLLAFRAGGERFAVPLERVREAARPRRIVGYRSKPHNRRLFFRLSPGY